MFHFLALIAQRSYVSQSRDRNNYRLLTICESPLGTQVVYLKNWMELFAALFHQLPQRSCSLDCQSVLSYFKRIDSLFSSVGKQANVCWLLTTNWTPKLKPSIRTAFFRSFGDKINKKNLLQGRISRRSISSDQSVNW